MNRMRMIPIAFLLLLFLAERANAEITVIPLPDEEYQEATTKIDLSGIPFGRVTSITDGTLTVTFQPGPTDHDPDTGLQVEKDSDSRFWSPPPYSEVTPPVPVLVNYNRSLIMDLSIPVKTFGFELQGFSLDPWLYDVDFVFVNEPDESKIVGTINLSLENVCLNYVGCAGGARLFAATTEDIPFNRIVIRNQDDYFFLAQIRYAVDEECLDVDVDIKPGDGDNVIKLSKAKSIPVAILSNANPLTPFDAATVDPSTVCFGHAGDPRQNGDCTAHGRHIEDVNGDQFPDLVLRFDTLATGIQPGDTEACLMGKTFSGVCIKGCDKVQPKVK